MHLLATGAFLSLFGCSSTVTLKPTISGELIPAKIQKSVAVNHTQEFLEYQQSVDAYGNRHEFILPIGAASDALLRKIYPRLFQHLVNLEGLKPQIASKGRIDVILQPEIEAFQFPLQSLKGPYWAEVVYRFTLYTPEGNTIYSWMVKGWGEGGDGSIYGELGPIADSVDSAMSNAAKKFVNSFENVPEIKRWATGMPIESATASLDTQRIRSVPEFGANAQEGIYDGIVTARAKFYVLTVKGADEGKELGPTGLFGVRVLLRNIGNGRIEFDPSDFAFYAAGGQKLDPTPGSYVASALATRYGRLSPVAPGVGLAALPNLIIGLANAAADTAERKEIETQLHTWRREELHETLLSKGTEVEGLVFFPSSSSGLVSGELQMPVVELETATRYIVRIPLMDSSSQVEQSQ